MKLTKCFGLVWFVCCLILSREQAFGYDSDDEISKATTAPEAISKPETLPNRWMVILCSLSGDEEHETRLTQAVQQIVDSAARVFSVQSDHVRVLLSSQTMADSIANSKPCNRQTLSALSIELSSELNEDSQCFFIVLGHAHLENRSSQFNIEGADIDQLDYTKLFGNLPGRENVHWIALPVSGFWIKPLSKTGRVVISATEADLEITATEMPYAMGAVLSGTSEYAQLEDMDKDGSLSLLDLYLAVSVEVQQRFVKEDYLQTEHSYLDDNGDGRGSELQEPFLPKKEDEKEVSVKPKKYRDGDQAKTILLKP